MHVMVMGAGAVGAYFGGLLALAGHEVTLVGRALHVDAISANGLRLDSPRHRGAVSVRAVTDALAVALSPDLVLFCVKSMDTESAGRALLPVLGPTTDVLSLQNGIDNAERLAAVIKKPVIPAVVYVGVGMIGPGHVAHFGGGELAIGPSVRSVALAHTLTQANIPTIVSPTIAKALWIKLIQNCALNAISGIVQMSYGPILNTPQARALITTVVAECVEVARADGITVPDDMMASVDHLVAKMPDQLSSTARDLARNKASEIDFLNGHVVTKGAERGVATPANLALLALVKLAERRTP